jgi:hypothetical protein
VTGKRVAVVQSNYIPWKGYFDLIRGVDEFILFDDVQYTRRDWRNRNLIKSPRGPAWLSIPVNTKGRYLDAIKDITIGDPGWARKHWSTLVANYSRAACFGQFQQRFEELYLGCREERLSAVNRRLIEAVCELLGITTRLSYSMDYSFDRYEADKNTRLLQLCQRAGATSYLSGPTARGYLDEELFARAGVAVEFIDYSSYREYPQLYPPFEHRVSALDLLFNTGAEAPRYLSSG